VALAVDMPRDRGVRRAHFVVAGRSRGRAGVDGNVGPEVVISNERISIDSALNEIGVVVSLIVDNSKDLCLHTDIIMCSYSTRLHQRTVAKPSEIAVVKRRLELKGGVASTSGRVRPVHLAGLAHHHVHAVLPLVWGVEFSVGLVVVAALETYTRKPRSARRQDASAR